jgi:hypothetical protein
MALSANFATLVVECCPAIRNLAEVDVVVDRKRNHHPTPELKAAIHTAHINNPAEMQTIMHWLDDYLEGAKKNLMTADTKDGTVERLQGQALTLTEIISVLSNTKGAHSS